MSDLQQLYQVRFSEAEAKKKSLIWKEICRFLKKYLSCDACGDKLVVDIAAGYADFINNYETRAKKVAIDVNQDLVSYTSKDIETIIDGVENITKYFEHGSVSLFFQSNFYEHITKQQITQLLKDEFVCLSEGGQNCILTPNIRYVGGKYWDFYDHITPITEKALIEEAESIGYEVKKVICKFLPYTTKSALPQSPWLVRLYLLLMPISGAIFGEQSLIILKKPYSKGEKNT